MIQDCFGGTGVVDYAFADIKNVKAVVPFHGGLTSLAPIQTEVVHPYVLIQSGGEDDAHGNNTELELMLNGGNATWEISRYSGTFPMTSTWQPKSDRRVLTVSLLHWLLLSTSDVYHGFTHWGEDAYNPSADWRSWDAMLSVFDMLLDPE